MSFAYRINDAGQVLGWAEGASWSTRGFLINPEDTNADGRPTDGIGHERRRRQRPHGRAPSDY